jgi:hypothetical protein
MWQHVLDLQTPIREGHLTRMPEMSGFAGKI